MKYTHILFFLLTLIIAGCSDNNDEPKIDENRLVGYWAIAHIKTIEHIDDSHSTTDHDVPPHGIESYITVENYRYDVLIFDEDFVTVRGDIPNRPRLSDYDTDTPDGQIEYCEALERWYNFIGDLTDQFGCPVSTYDIKDGNLIIGSLNMGSISFASDNEFTLDFKKPLNKYGDYHRSIYTFSRIYSLLL